MGHEIPHGLDLAYRQIRSVLYGLIGQVASSDADYFELSLGRALHLPVLVKLRSALRHYLSQSARCFQNVGNQLLVGSAHSGIASASMP